MMRVGLLSLALAAGVAAPALAEPVLPFAPFLLVARQAAVVPATPRISTETRSSTDTRDTIVQTNSDVRPQARPDRFVAPVRTASVNRRIVRLPWSTGVFQ